MNAQEIMIAFNTQNDKKVWTAQARTSANGADAVYFGTTNGMVSLVYHVEAKQFAVRFHKFQGAWGDYIKAISRSLYTVLTTLKSAGLPFEAPPSIVGVEIVTTVGDDNSVYVRWPGMIPVNPVMPELRDRVQPLANVTGYVNGLVVFDGGMGDVSGDGPPQENN